MQRLLARESLPGVAIAELGAGKLDEVGGISLVQSPGEAQFPTMPNRAIKEDDVDGAFPVAEIADVLVALAAGGTVEPGASRIVAP